MVYCSPTNVRSITNIDTSDLSDAELTLVIAEATTELNSNLNCKVVREKIDYIDETRENKIDGSNKNYYIRNWEHKYIADMDNDGDVDISDIIVYAVTSEGTETTATISTIIPNEGKFVLSTAYSSDYKLYVTYEWSYVSEYDPHKLVKLACTFLSAAYGYAKINFGRAPNISFGNVRLYRHMESFDKYYRLYQNTVNLINAKSVDYKEAEVF